MFTILKCFEMFLPRINSSLIEVAKLELAKLNALLPISDAELNKILINALCEKPYWRYALAFVLDEDEALAKKCQDEDRENNFNFFTQLLEKFVVSPNEYPEFRFLPMKKMSSYNIFLGIFWFSEKLRMSQDGDKENEILYCLKASKYQNIRAIFEINLNALKIINEGVDDVTLKNLEKLVLSNSESIRKCYEFSGNLLFCCCILRLAEFCSKIFNLSLATEFYKFSLFAFYWAHLYSNCSDATDSIKAEIYNVAFTKDYEYGEKEILTLFFKEKEGDWLLIEKSLENKLPSKDVEEIKNEVAIKFAEVHGAGASARFTCS